MLFSSLLTIFAAASSVAFANILGSEHREARVCREQLEGIVYVPQVCAYDYLKKITKTLVAQSPLLWTDQAASVLKQFRQKYGVYAILIDAFGNIIYNPPNIVELPFLPKAQSVFVERAWALGEGFSTYDREIQIGETDPIILSLYAYSTNVWNMNGEMYTLAVGMNKTDAPTYC